jgi:hypothetical protein
MEFVEGDGQRDDVALYAEYILPHQLKRCCIELTPTTNDYNLTKQAMRTIMVP